MLTGVACFTVFSAGLAALALPRFASANDLQGKVLRIGTWGGSWRDALDKMIGASLRARGLTIEYVLGNASNNFAKLVAARGRALPLDSMELVPDILPLLMQGKFVDKINLDRVPNAKSIPALAKWDYVIGTTAHQAGVVYNAKKFEEAGVAPPQRISDLANPKLAGRVAFPDVAHGAHFKAVAAPRFRGRRRRNHARKGAAAHQENQARALLLELAGPCHQVRLRRGVGGAMVCRVCRASQADQGSRSLSCTRPMAASAARWRSRSTRC